MNVESAPLLAMTLNFVTFGVVAVWLFVPWARTRSLAQALTPLVLIHTGRTIALQLYSAQADGYAITDRVRDEIVWGDQVGAVIAIATLVVLWRRPSAVRPVAWLLVAVTVIDLANAFVRGIQNELLGAATDVSWMILTFYVPLLWVSIGLVAWLLLDRQHHSTAERPKEDVT